MGVDRQIVFKCPQTDLNVQHRLTDEPDDRTHVSVSCPACTRLHLIDRTTGKLLGDRRG
ncbi:hypothetical protein [Bradyrhizobium vignae]|uniref:Uncharacterized protein n=1 Tax=Bradyrhizobium vignae TaxID=1549949 RepID=A0A2U3PR57_9BRAD|nr:hypothetical protein [Bradyrhizobium vignae]SPP91633.1 conserved protein of unknown function [Bradyrhizobium vignae]